MDSLCNLPGDIGYISQVFKYSSLAKPIVQNGSQSSSNIISSNSGTSNQTNSTISPKSSSTNTSLVTSSNSNSQVFTQISNSSNLPKVNPFNPVISRSFPIISLISLTQTDGKYWKLDVKDAQTKQESSQNTDQKSTKNSNDDLLNGTELQIWEDNSIAGNNLNQLFAYNTESNEIYYNPNRSLVPNKITNQSREFIQYPISLIKTMS